MAAAQQRGAVVELCVQPGFVRQTEMDGPHGEKWIIRATEEQMSSGSPEIRVTVQLRHLGNARKQRSLAPGYRDAIRQFRRPHEVLLLPGKSQEFALGGEVAAQRPDGSIEYVPYGFSVWLQS